MSAALPRWGERVAYATAGQQSREAMERLQEAAAAEEVSFMGFRIGAHVISFIGSYSKLNEVMLQKKIAEAVGATVSTVCRWLKRLHALGVIGWFGNTKGDSWAALAVHHLPVTSEERILPAGEPETSCSQDAIPLLLPADNTEREAFDEKNTWERESVPLPAAIELTSDSPEDESLSPVETHESDAMFAADRLATHLFAGLPDPVTRTRMYRGFLRAPIGSCTRVLQLALLGNPARTIDYPAGYAARWIDNAVEKLLTTDAQLLTPELAVA